MQIADTEVRAQAQEAEANAAQIEARLGLTGGGAVRDRPRAGSRQRQGASHDLAQADFERARMLVDEKLLPQADFDRSRAQAEAARRQYDIARNSAEQQYQSLLAARARMTLARKALADTVVRAPFDGVVEQRLVSVGDYVTRGTKVASVMRINPLRVELTVPGQYLSAVAAGRAVSLEVDAYPGQTFTGRIRYVSPACRPTRARWSSRRSCRTSRASSSPGSSPRRGSSRRRETPAVLVPASGDPHRCAGTARVYVVDRESHGRGTHRHHRPDGGRPDRDHQRPHRPATPSPPATWRSSPTACASPGRR